MEAWMFFCFSLFFSIFLTVSVVCCVMGVGRNFVVKLQHVVELDVRKGLASQGLLWLAIFIPIAVGFTVGLWVWPNYYFDASAAGFKHFVEISIVSLALMSLALPLAGLVSSFHSTQQTAEQIEVASFKNNLDAFYSHRKELMSYFSALQDVLYFNRYNYKYYLHPVLHIRFFEGSPSGGFPLVKKEYFDFVAGKILDASKYLTPVLEKQEFGVTPLDCYLRSCGSLIEAAQALHVREVCNDQVARGVMVRSQLCKRGFDLQTIGVSTLEMLAAIRFTKGFFDNLCDFSGVPRLSIPEGQEIVFSGGQRVLDNEPAIEHFHRDVFPEMVAYGTAEYAEQHHSILVSAQHT